MSYEFKIYEYDHFYRAYEDRRNNLYILTLNDDVEKWLDKNVISTYDINCDDHYNNGDDFIIIEFKDLDDAFCFEMWWL